MADLVEATPVHANSDDQSKGYVLVDTKVSQSKEGVANALMSLRDHPNDIPAPFRKVTDPRKVALLVAMTTTPVIGDACAAAGCTPRTLYNWRHKGDADFEAAYEVAKKMGIRVAEDEAWRRAFDGNVEDVYGSLGNNQGTGVVGQRRVKSDTMLIFMLKGAAPEKYRERFEHSGPNGSPIEMVHLTAEQLLDRHRELIEVEVTEVPAAEPKPE